MKILQSDYKKFCDLFDLSSSDTNNFEIYQVMDFYSILNKLRKDLSYYQHFICATDVAGGTNA